MNFTITKDLDNYTATYDLEGSCDLVDQETTMEEISIEKYIKRDNTYIKITDQWVNEPVYLLVKFLNINKYQVIDDNFNYTIGGNETNKKGILDKEVSMIRNLVLKVERRNAVWKRKKQEKIFALMS